MPGPDVGSHPSAAGGPAVATPPSGPTSVSVERDGDVCRLAGTIDFTTARQTLESVSPLVQSGTVSRIDLGGIVRSNSAGLALMVEWLGVARRAGHPLGFTGVPDGLRQLAGVCQVDALVG